ncbi:hypothetical protein AAII07_15125 [Microvirga sp. 0TCS3.31]
MRSPDIRGSRRPGDRERRDNVRRRTYDDAPPTEVDGASTSG